MLTLIGTLQSETLFFFFLADQNMPSFAILGSGSCLSCSIHAAQLLTRSPAVWLSADLSHPITFMQVYSAAFIT